MYDFEKEFRLKYLYLIDVREILAKIKNNRIYNSFNANSVDKISDLLHMIFNEIITASTAYTEYVISNKFTTNVFFNENCIDKQVELIRGYMAVSLFHHCLLQSYQDSVTQLQADKIQMTTRNEYSIRRGILNPASSKEALELLLEANANSQDEYASQIDNSRNKHFVDCKNNYYSSYILNTLRHKSSNGKYYTAAHTSLFAYFLWDKKSAHNFNKTLSSSNGKTSTLITHYHKMYNDYLDWIRPLSVPDSLLFKYYMESSYSFDFTNYVRVTLNNMSSLEHETSLLKSLEGETFITLLCQANEIPITFNKTIFLEYALKAINSTNIIKSNYPPPPRTAISYAPISPQNTTTQTAESFKILNDYFHMLKYVTCPIIEDLWYVLTHPDNLGIVLDFSCYCKYLEKYHSFITANYLDLYPKQPAPTDFYRLNFQELYYTLYKTHPSKHKIVMHDFNINTDSSKRALKLILKQYCTPTRATHITTAYSTGLQIHKLLPCAHWTEQETFMNAHLHSIYNFIKNI